MKTTPTPSGSRPHPRSRGRWLACGAHALDRTRRRRRIVGCGATASIVLTTQDFGGSIASEARSQPQWLDMFDPTGMLLADHDAGDAA